MKKLTVLIFVVGIALAIGWYFRGIRGNGVIVTEGRSISEFARVRVSGAFQIQWSQGKPGLTISTDQNLLPYILTSISGQVLKLDAQKNLNPTKNIVVKLSSASLADVELTGANTFRASEITGDDLRLHSTGASTITVDGSVKKLTVNLTGASTLHAQSLQVQTAKIAMTGASTAVLNVTDALKASITGAGTLTYSGNPKTVEKQVTGIGSIKHQP